MQIGQRFVTGYDNGLQEQVHTGQAKNVEQTTAGKSSVDLSGLKEGTVFRGEVLDVVGDKVTISLENQAKLMARLQAGVELGAGDKLLFSVKENTANQILIKPMFDSLYSAQTQVLEKALDMAGLSPTEKNFAVAKELMDAGMPVDKGSMVNILSQSMKFQGTSLHTLVALNERNLPVTPENIAQYERYQGLQHQLTGDIGQAADAMADFVKAFPEGTDGQTLLQVADQITDLFVPEGETQSMTSETIQTVNVDNTKGTPELLEETEKTTVSLAKEQPEVLSRQEKGNPEEMISKTMQDTSNVQEIHQEGNGATIRQSIDVFLKQEDTGVSKETVMQAADLLKAEGLPEAEIAHTIARSQSDEALLKNILHIVKTSDMPQEAIRSFLQNDAFKNLMSEIIKRGFALDPKRMKDAKEIDKLYESILKNAKAFEDAVTSNGGDAKQFQQSFQNMRQNLQFMDQLNQQMIYAQMPIKLSNKQANSELYVYADKRKLQQKRDGISVMLHLDMDHLGATDVKVTLTGNNVHARFYFNDSESVEIVTQHMDMLAKQLAKRGFSLTNEVVKRQPRESINKVVDEVIDENAERSIKRYTFDART